MTDVFLVDTDVLVDYLRERKEAVAFLEEQITPLVISTITSAELYAGVREGKEFEALEQFLQAFEIAPVDEIIAKKGGLYRRDFGPSHGVGLADALIAATAKVKQATLVTLNKRHFPMIRDILIPYRKFIG